MAEIIAALLVILPGACIAALVLPRDSRFGIFLCESIVWSLLLDSAIAWAPGGSVVPIWAWAAFLILPAIVGAIIIIARGLRCICAYQPREYAWRFLVPACVIIVYALIVMVRPNVDWDAITYYLPVSVQYVASGHVTPSVFPYVSSVPGAPNIGPPIMPQIYALAIVVAEWLHATADNSVRLIAVVFLFGIYLSTLQLARRYLSEGTARFAALLALVLPAITSAVVAYPLYLDLGFTFLVTYFVSELGQSDTSGMRYLRVGALAAAVALFKVDGFALIGLSILAFTFVRVRTPLALAGTALCALAMVGIAVKVGFIAQGYPLALWIAVIAASALYVGISGRAQERIRLPVVALGGLALGFSPAAIHAANMMRGIGSVAGYYIPTWVHNVPPAWHTALSRLADANVFASSLQPGVPSNFGAALVLWSGFGPMIGALALIACILAIAKKSAVCELVGITVSFDLAFLTIFKLDELRHLLPIVPLVAILAVWAIRAVAQSRATLFLLAGIALISLIPFAWAAQEGTFGPASPLLTRASWDQWNSLSTQGLTNSFILVVLLGCAMFCVLRIEPRIRQTSAALSSLRALTRQHLELICYCSLGLATILASIALFLFGTETAIVLLCAILALTSIVLLAIKTSTRTTIAVATAYTIVVAFFIPLWSTAASPGLSAQADTIGGNWYGGYAKLLATAMNDGSVKKLLTYKSYGVTWFSLGQMQRIDLIDATDLAYYSEALSARTAPSLIRSLGIQASILPTPGSVEWPTFVRVLTSLGHDNIAALENPLFGAQELTAQWTLTMFYPGTSTQVPSRILARSKSGNELLLVNRTSLLPEHTEAIDVLTIRPIPSAWSRRATPVHVRVLWKFGDQPEVSPFQHTIVELDAHAGTLTLPINRLLAASEFSGAIKINSIRIFEILVTAPGSPERLDFRSPGLSLYADGKLAGITFLLHPEWSIVRSLDVRPDDRGLMGLHLYPRPMYGSASPGIVSLTLRPSNVCKNPDLASVRFTITKDGDDISQSVTIVARPRNLKVDVDLDALGASLRAIQISANAPDCNVAETLLSQAPVGASSSEAPVPLDDLSVSSGQN